MIIGIPEKKSVGTVQDYALPTSDAFTLGAQEALADNPFTKFYQWYQTKYQATGEQLPFEEAKNRAQEAGVELPIPDEGMRSDALELLIERQRQRKVREDALASVKGGFSKGTLNIGGNLAGSFLDPLNIATSFIPIGSARYAAALAKAKTPLQRAATRASFGAIEGAVGSAALEPLSYFASQELGDEYTLGNSLMNIAFGTALGAGLHMGVGATADALAKGKGWQGSGPQGKIPNEVSGLSPEGRFSLGKTAIAQAARDRLIDMEPTRALLEAGNQAAIQNSMDTKSAIEVASDLLEKQVEGRLSISMDERLKLAKGFDEEAFKRVEQIKADNLILKENASKLSEEMRVPKNELETVQARLEEIQKTITGPKLPIEELDKLQAEENALLKKHTEIQSVLDPKQEEYDAIINAVGTKGLDPELNQRIASAYKQAGEVMKNDPKTSQLDPLIDRQMNAKPDSRFIDEKILEQHTAEIAELNPETRLEEATEMMNDEVTALKEMTDQMGIENKSILEKADEILKTAKDYAKAVKAYSLCSVRKT